MTWRDALQWYRRWYAPNNATLIIVGDVDPQQVFTLAKRYYGPVARRAVPERKAMDEPAQRGIKHVIVKAPAELPFVRLAYKAPKLRDAANDWEPFALSLLAQILGGDDASQLNQILVREGRVATSASAEYEMISRGPGMVFVEAEAAQGHGGRELEAAIREVINRILSKGVSAEELERAKVQLLARIVYRRDSLFAQALEIGQLEMSGLSFRDADRIPERFKAITVEQIQGVAAKYLVDDGLTVALLDPQPMSPRRAAGASPAIRH